MSLEPPSLWLLALCMTWGFLQVSSIFHAHDLKCSKACGRNVVHGSGSPENGEREIGKTSILAAPPAAELAVVSLL